MLLLAALTASLGQAGAQTPLPTPLQAALARAQLAQPVAAWCAGDLIAGQAREHAVAVPSPAGGGRYMVVGVNGSVTLLVAYAGAPNLACHSPAQASALSASIGRTATVQGAIKPHWRTTVVCGFVENTHAVCWQYSPAEQAFVKVGEWTT